MDVDQCSVHLTSKPRTSFKKLDSEFGRWKSTTALKMQKADVGKMAQC